MVTADIHECKKIRSSLAKEESNLSLSNWESAIMEKSTAYYEDRINSRMKDLFEEFNLKTSSRREKVVSIDIEGRSDVSRFSTGCGGDRVRRLEGLCERQRNYD